jgi:membrane-bound ClpP family serine protease
VATRGRALAVGRVARKQQTLFLEGGKSFMLQIPTGQMTEADRAILRRVRVWIAALAVACLVVGVGLGALALYVSCRGRPHLGSLAALVLLLALAEIALGGLMVLWQVPLATAIMHQALGVATFGVISLLMWRANAPVSDPQGVHVRSLSRA